MAAKCDRCGRGLSVLERARGHTLCGSCTVEVKAELDRSLADYEAALTAAIQAGTPDEIEVERLRAVETAIAVNGGDASPRKAAYYRSYLDNALADEVLTAEEERTVDSVGNALYPEAEREAQRAVLADYRGPLFIAMVNDGRLPKMTEARMVLKRSEVLHLAEPAKLLKEVIQREFQAGSHGMSFRVMKGVSYRVGSMRGRMVEVGRSFEPIDEGELCITSLRAVYTGTRKTIEMPYTKLLDLNVYTDALQVHLSNRQNPPTFRVADGPMIAAAINAAAQKAL